MELAMTPMTERQRKYRENYRERVAEKPLPHLWLSPVPC